MKWWLGFWAVVFGLLFASIAPQAQYTATPFVGWFLFMVIAYLAGYTLRAIGHFIDKRM